MGMWMHQITRCTQAHVHISCDSSICSIPGTSPSKNPQGCLQSSGIYCHRTPKNGLYISQYWVKGVLRNPWGTMKTSEMVRIEELPGMISRGIHGNPLEFCWNSMGSSFIVMWKNSTAVKNRTLTLATHDMSKWKCILEAALWDHWKYPSKLY